MPDERIQPAERVVTESSQKNHGVPKHWWLAGAVGLCVVATLPFLGNWLRQDSQLRCSLDGQTIDPAYVVQVFAETGNYKFCCLLCTELWLKRTRQPVQRIEVIDETHGRTLDARDAIYVDGSKVFSNPAAGDRRHVFRHRKDALSHMETFGGHVLTGKKRPFAN